MASQNKKNKAKNSFMYDGGEKGRFIKLKGLMFFQKKDRIVNKKVCKDISKGELIWKK